MLRALLGFLKRLLAASSVHPAPYVEHRRTTKTGKLRATGGPLISERGPGTDWAIYKVRGLSKSAKKVYAYLSAIADSEGYCFPFYRTISKRTDLSTSAVAKAINELEEFGLLSRAQRVSRRGGSSNLYLMKRVSDVLPEPEKPAEEPQDRSSRLP